VAPDIQLILVVTKQDAEVWLLHGESQLVRLVDQLPGVSRSAFHGQMDQIFKPDIAGIPGHHLLVEDSLEHQIGDAHGVFVVKIQEFPGFHHTEIRLYHSCGLDGDGDPADPGFIGGLSLEETVPFHVDTVAEGVAGMGKLGRPVIGFADPLFFTGLFEVV